MKITAAELRALLDYDEGRGVFSRKGREIGSKHCCGYICVHVSGRKYLAHRLAWLYVYGSWPTGCIDHIDMNRANNAIRNLRDVNASINQQNVRLARVTNVSGMLGASFDKQTGRWLAQIRHGGRKVHLGRFTTPTLAHEAYLAAKRTYHIGNTI